MSAPEIINPATAGGGVPVGGSGTPGKLAKFTGTGTSIGDSLLSESGTTITSAATAETFGSAQTWTVGAPNSQALVVLSNAGAERTLVLDTISRAVGVGTTFGPGTLLHVSDGSGAAFAGSTYDGVRLGRATEALFSSSDYTRSFRAGITASTAVVGTSTAHDLLLQRANVTAATLQSGAIASVTLTAGGAGYTSATYSQQALTGGTGAGATANIVVAGGIVTVLVLMSPGTGYAVGDTLSCATIGAGAGFVLTVDTIAQIVAGSGNVTAQRIGAGTANPIAGLDIANAASINGFLQFFPAGAISASTGATAYSSSFQIVNIGSRAADYDLSSVGATGFFYPINLAPVITNLSGNLQAIQCRPILKSTSGTVQASGLISVLTRATSSDLATVSHNGFNALFTLLTGASAAASYSQSTLRGSTVTFGLNAPGTTTEVTGFKANISGTSTHAITTSHGFWQEASTFSGVTTVTNFYGFRLGAITVTSPSTITNAYGLRLEAFAGTGTITNRWGISQEDAAAKNYFAGNVGIGTASPTAALHLPASTTARASLNITSGAAPTAPNNGDIWFDGTNIKMQIGGVTKIFTLV